MSETAATRKVIASHFSMNGFTLQVDGLKYIESLYSKLPREILEARLSNFVRNIYSIAKQTGKENTYLVNRELLEEALKLGVDDSASKTAMDEENINGVTSENHAPNYSDKISDKLSNSTIILSNFGELPRFSFRNQARELEVFPAINTNKGIIVSGKEIIEGWIEKYHKMRYLLKQSGNYIYQHELDARRSVMDSKSTRLHEIGTLFGAKGQFTIFGVVYKKDKKYD